MKDEVVSYDIEHECRKLYSISYEDWSQMTDEEKDLFMTCTKMHLELQIHNNLNPSRFYYHKGETKWVW